MLCGKILRNRYKILEKLGSGGFSDTYLATDTDLPGNPTCVVKHLQTRNPSPEILQIAKRLFNQEAEVLYRLGKHHNQIPGLLAHFEENGEFYLVQEYIDGHDLTMEIIPGMQLSEAQTTKLLREILEVLAVVHNHNVIHRDIKLQNIMRRQDGKIVLIDFGSVKEINSLAANTQGEVSPTVVIGTPGYIPHEQANGNPRLCSDVYAVGMIGIQALTGIIPRKLPVDSHNGEIVWRNLVDVSDEFANILTNMVRHNCSQRYQTATEALQALQWPLPTTIGPVPQSTGQVSRRSSSKFSYGQGIQTLGLMMFIGMGFGFAIFRERFFQFSFRENQPSQTTNSPVQGSKKQVKTTPSPTIINPKKNGLITSPSIQPQKQLNQPAPEAIAPPPRDDIQLNFPLLRQTIMPSPVITQEKTKPSPSPTAVSPVITQEKIKPSASPIEDNSKPCTPAIENNTDSCTSATEENIKPSPPVEDDDDTKPCTPAIESNTELCSPANEESIKPSTPTSEQSTKLLPPAGDSEINNQMMIVPSIPALEESDDKEKQLIVPSTPIVKGDHNQMVVPSTPIVKSDHDQMVVPSTPVK